MKNSTGKKYVRHVILRVEGTDKDKVSQQAKTLGNPKRMFPDVDVCTVNIGEGVHAIPLGSNNVILGDGLNIDITKSTVKQDGKTNTYIGGITYYK